MWQTCACPNCQPCLHENIIHAPDHQPFNLLRGLSFRAHDAWRIACLAIASFTGLLHLQGLQQQWTRWAKKYQLFDSRQAAASRLNNEALIEVVEIFSDIFFLGQLPSSKIRVHWGVLEKNQLGFLQPGYSHKDRITLWLNCDHTALRNCAERILCVVLHEMAHAFFDYYACYPWNKAHYTNSTCGRLYYLNIGMTGHGRAWQHLTHHIQKATRDALGFEGDLGRKAGMCQELNAGGKTRAFAFVRPGLTERAACIPCLREVESLYQWYPSRWWESTIRSRDDDAVRHLCLSTKGLRNRAWNSTPPKHGRSNSI